jgi:hypothetical protein
VEQFTCTNFRLRNKADICRLHDKDAYIVRSSDLISCGVPCASIDVMLLGNIRRMNFAVPNASAEKILSG